MENQKALIEIALEIIEEANGAINIYKLIEETLARKGVTDDDGSLAAKLYTDITVSSKFVFMGDDMWDLKSRQSLEEFDKDGSSFNSKDDYDEDDEDDNDGYVPEEDEVEEDDEDSYDEESDDEESDESEDDTEDDEEYDEDSNDDLDFEDDDEDDSYDDTDEEEKRYNEIMDDYEDLYEN